MRVYKTSGDSINNNKGLTSKLEDDLIQAEMTCLNQFGYNKSTNTGWSDESKFRDAERKYIRSGKYRYINNNSMKDSVAEILINTYVRD